MESNAYYLKKIRDILNQRLEIEKSFNGISSNQDAKYLKDIYNVVKDLPGGGGSNTVIINGECITSFEQEVYKCSTPFADVCEAIKDGRNVNLSITNDFAHTFGNIGDYFEFKRMEVDPLSEEIISITFERLYKKSSTKLCNDTIIYSATDTNNEHTLIKTEWTVAS